MNLTCHPPASTGYGSDSLFSTYKIRKWRQAGGKFNTCALLDSIRSETKNRERKRRVTDFVLLHRSMYMNEREAKNARREVTGNYSIVFVKNVGAHVP